MTLILGMSKPEGIYMCVDYRVTEQRSGRVISDVDRKVMCLTFGPLDGGAPRVLLAYTGAARASDQTPTEQWIRETVRGEDEHIDVTMSRIRDRLDRDFAIRRVPLVVNMMVLQPGKRFFGGFTNTNLLSGEVRDCFEYHMNEVHLPGWFVNGAAGVSFMGSDHERQLTHLLDVHPRRAKDFMTLLATVNRRLAHKNPTISAHSQVAFVPDSGGALQAMCFTEEGEAAPFGMSHVFAGIDLTDLQKQSFEALQATKAGLPIPSPSDEESMRQQTRRP